MFNLCAINILTYIIEHKFTTARELSEVFELSKRTIYRYIELFICNNVPIRCKKGVQGGYFIDKTFCLNNFVLNSDEKNYLLNILKIKNDKTALSISVKLNLNIK